MQKWTKIQLQILGCNFTSSPALEEVFQSLFLSSLTRVAFQVISVLCLKSMLHLKEASNLNNLLPV